MLPSAETAPPNEPPVLPTKSLAAEVAPFKPLPISPARLLTLASNPALSDAKFVLAIAPLAAADAEFTCADTEETNLAKGFVDNAILNDFSYYSVFILDKICYYIN
jgi:hypothetical protein